MRGRIFDLHAPQHHLQGHRRQRLPASLAREDVPALAHTIGDKAEQAYRRDNALERRRPLMEAWAAFCEPCADDNVVPMRAVR